MPVRNIFIWWFSVFLDSLKLPLVFHTLQKEQNWDSNVYCMTFTVQKNHKYSYRQQYFWQVSCLVSQWRKWHANNHFAFQNGGGDFFSVHQQTLSFTFGELHRQVLQAMCPRFKATSAQWYCSQNPLSLYRQPSSSPCSKPRFALSLIYSARETELLKSI